MKQCGHSSRSKELQRQRNWSRASPSPAFLLPMAFDPWRAAKHLPLFSAVTLESFKRQTRLACLQNGLGFMLYLEAAYVWPLSTSLTSRFLLQALLVLPISLSNLHQFLPSMQCQKRTRGASLALRACQAVLECVTSEPSPATQGPPDTCCNAASKSDSMWSARVSL